MSEGAGGVGGAIQQPSPNRHGLIFPDDMADELKELNLTVNDVAYEVLALVPIFGPTLYMPIFLLLAFLLSEKLLVK